VVLREVDCCFLELVSILRLSYSGQYLARAAVLGMLVAAFWYGPPKDERKLPLNHPTRNQNLGTYHSSRASASDGAHNSGLGPSAEAQREVLASQVLSNVREQNHYMGENLGIPSRTGAEELMFGGTRPPAPSMTSAIRRSARAMAASSTLRSMLWNLNWR